MIRASLKGMLGRKLRTGLTVLAIVLGVAMVSGSYVLTDTMQGAADELSASSYQGVDAVVTTREAFDADTQSGFSEAEPLPASVAELVRAVPGVAIAAGEITDTAKLIDREGEVIGSQGGPTFAVGYDTRTPGAGSLSPFEFEAGRFPRGPGEVAIDAGTADREDYAVGDTIRVAGRGPAQRFRVVGIATFGSVESIGTATAAIFELSQAQALFRKPGRVDSVLVAGDRGVPTARLRRDVARALPASAQVRSAEEQDRFDIGGLKEFLDIIQTALVAFGGVALFVGAFIIFNTLSITVAQRAREFALLRTIGASRGQILRSVVLEAAVTGMIASVIGILVGLGLAEGLSSLLASLGLDLPQSETVVARRTIVVAFAVGILIPVLAGLAPATRATRVEPVAALREGAPPPGRHSRVAPVAAVLATGVGIALLAYGSFGNGLAIGERLAALGAGCLILFVGIALLSARLVRPLASVLGRPARRIAGAAGALARENSMRNPGRTATTAAALMIGLALVTFVATLGAGMRSSFGDALEEQLDADYVVTAQDGFSPFAPEAVGHLQRSPDIQVVAGLREDQVRAFDEETSIAGIDPDAFDSVYQFNWKQGSDARLRALGPDEAIVSSDYAEDHDLHTGDRIEAITRAGRKLSLSVQGIDDRSTFNPLGLPKIAIRDQTFRSLFPTRRVRYLFANASTEPSEAMTARLQRGLQAFPDAKLQTRSDYRKDAEADINDFLLMLYVLLALSVIISLFGIVNTLVLAVFERTRELGMLRAVGMTRRQVRRMIRHESVIVALIGGVLGMALGVFLAALVTRALSEEDISFALPVGSLIFFAVVAVIAGMLAAILPARRASRLDVLQALQYE